MRSTRIWVHGLPAVALAVGTLVAAAVVPAPATAQSGPAACTSSYSFTGDVVVCTVPPGMHQVTISAIGGQGGRTNDGIDGGQAGVTTASVAVQPGDALDIFVGGAGGGGGGFGGASGGADGEAAWFDSFSGAGGGGSSEVRVNGVGTRLVVAGGGGGGGGGSNIPVAGGTGGQGGNGGAYFAPDGHTFAAGGADASGYQGSGGSGGCGGCGDGNGTDGGSSSSGDGGGGGGGGGGGYTSGAGGGGGGFGGGGGGGGGGLSYADPAAAGVSYGIASTGGNGSVSLSFSGSDPGPPAGPPPRIVPVGAPTTFSSPGNSTFHVPADVTALTITAAGGAGGGASGGAGGGTGDVVTATVPVAPGSIVVVVVGADGGCCGGFGFGPGGSHGTASGSSDGASGGGGGGASAVYQSVPLVVAGGGGGSGGGGDDGNGGQGGSGGVTPGPGSYGPDSTEKSGWGGGGSAGSESGDGGGGGQDGCDDVSGAGGGGGGGYQLPGTGGGGAGGAAGGACPASGPAPNRPTSRHGGGGSRSRFVQQPPITPGGGGGGGGGGGRSYVDPGARGVTFGAEASGGDGSVTLTPVAGILTSPGLSSTSTPPGTLFPTLNVIATDITGDVITNVPVTFTVPPGYATFPTFFNDKIACQVAAGALSCTADTEPNPQRTEPIAEAQLEANAPPYTSGPFSVQATAPGFLPYTFAGLEVSLYPTTTAITSSTPTNESGLGDPVQFTAVVKNVGGPYTPPNPFPIPTGNVVFTVDGKQIPGGPVPLAPNGSATSPAVSDLTLGAHVVKATYQGDAAHQLFEPSSSMLTQTVGRATTLTIASSANPVAANGSVTFTATLSGIPRGGPAPTGTVQFSIDHTDLGAPVRLARRAPYGASTPTIQLPNPVLPAGSNLVEAEYSGDDNYPSILNGIVQFVDAAGPGPGAPGPPTAPTIAPEGPHSPATPTGPTPGGGRGLAFTGADTARVAGVGALLVVLGGIGVAASRRRRRAP